MSRDKIEWTVLSVLMLSVLTLGIFAIGLNRDSFWKVSKSIYMVKSEIGNFRAGPSINNKVIRKLEYGDILSLSYNKGEWYKGRYQFLDGWIHRSIIGRYLYIGYFNEYEIGKSMFEVEWN